MSARAPIDCCGGRPTSSAEMSTARSVIGASGVLEPLAPFMTSPVGRPSTLNLEAFLVAAQLNALARHHRAHLVQIARVLNALSAEQRASLGLVRWDEDEAYFRVERLFVKLCKVLESAHESKVAGEPRRLDAAWFANAIARAAVPPELRVSTSIAVDGTDVETWGALRGELAIVDVDGDSETRPVEPDGSPLVRRIRKPKVKVLGVGPDGRKVYTADPDARAGHRSSTNSRAAGPYVGYELHLAVQARDVRWTNGVDRTTLGPEVAGLVTTFTLAPAGTHRARAIVPALLDAKRSGQPIADIVWDPGYSLCRPETAKFPLAKAGIHTTFQAVTHQRGRRPFRSGAQLIDGQLFSEHVPAELTDTLPMPPRGASTTEKETYEAAFNRRARYRYGRHAGPDEEGATRWRCPFCTGTLRSRAFPATMRRSRTAPLVAVSGTECCDGIVTVAAADLPLWQLIPFGTTAWRIAMGRRQVVESVNAALKGGYVDLARKFLRVFGLVKVTVLLGFTIAAFNLDRVQSFRAKQHARTETPRTRAKRRRGTWSLLLRDRDAVDVAQRPDPPPA
jgi:hypothetical protein